MNRIRLVALTCTLTLLVLSPPQAAAAKALEVVVELGPQHRLEASARWKPKAKTLRLEATVEVNGRTETLKSSLPVGSILRGLGDDLRGLERAGRGLVAEATSSLRDLSIPTIEVPPLPGFERGPSLREGLFAKPTASGSIESWAGPPLSYQLAYDEPHPSWSREWGRLGHPLEFEASLRAEWQLIGWFLQSEGLRCEDTPLLRGDLVIWAVSWDQMNVPWRVAEARRRFGRDFPELWGFYLPNEPSRGSSFIAVSGLGEDRSRSLLGHELAHHAYAACGLRTSWRGDTDSFAQAFDDWAYGRRTAL